MKLKFFEKLKEKLNSEKIKEFALVFSAVVLVGVGYMNFSRNPQNVDKTVETVAKSTNSIGDVQLVSSENVTLVENDNENVQNEVSKETASEIVEEDSNLEKAENIVEQTSSNSNKSYFTELRLNRDNIYSQKLDTYQKIIDSTTISSEQKSIAVQEIEKISTEKNAILVAEELIKLKGFEDSVIYINENSVSVVVRIAALSLEQVAQIQNIVSRELNTEVKNINISNK